MLAKQVYLDDTICTFLDNYFERGGLSEIHPDGSGFLLWIEIHNVARSTLRNRIQQRLGLTES